MYYRLTHFYGGGGGGDDDDDDGDGDVWISRVILLSQLCIICYIHESTMYPTDITGPLFTKR